jgi:hypothetical protein
MRSVGYVALWGRGEMYRGFWWGDLSEADHLEDLGVDVKVIIKWIFKKWHVEARTGLPWLRLVIGSGRL